MIIETPQAMFSKLYLLNNIFVIYVIKFYERYQHVNPVKETKMVLLKLFNPY